MPGPPPKPAGRRQRRNARAQLVLHKGGAVAAPLPREVPAAPKHWLAQTAEHWNAYWASPLAGAAELATDLPALERLFSLRDERERCYRAFRKARMVAGSKGQLRVNPLGQLMLTMDMEIRSLEDRFGLSAKARLALGIEYGKAMESLEAMNARLDKDDDSNGDGEEEDPRIALRK